MQLCGVESSLTWKSGGQPSDRERVELYLMMGPVG